MWTMLCMCVHVGWWGFVYAAMRAAELAEVWRGYKGRASWRLQWVLIMAVQFLRILIMVEPTL